MSKSIGQYIKVDQDMGQYIQVQQDVRIYCECLGTGDPIIFIPGWTFTTKVFGHQMKHFSKTHQAITYDPRSHGRSSTMLDGNNYTTHGKDLTKLIEALELQNVTLVGWSFGCLTLWEYIRQQGLNNIKKCVCVDLSPKPLSVNEKDWVEGPLDEIAAAYTNFLGSSKGQRDFITEYARQIMVQRELTREELFWIEAQSRMTSHYIAANLFASGMFSNYMAEAKIADDHLPVLYIVAEHWAETARAFIAKNFPNSRIESFGGHMMFWEYSEKI